MLSYKPLINSTEIHLHVLFSLTKCQLPQKGENIFLKYMPLIYYRSPFVLQTYGLNTEFKHISKI